MKMRLDVSFYYLVTSYVSFQSTLSPNPSNDRRGYTLREKFGYTPPQGTGDAAQYGEGIAQACANACLQQLGLQQLGISPL
jgi:hypothetical protein